MGRRLSRREKRLVLALTLVAVVAIAGLSMAPKESFTTEDVLAYYVNGFAGAEQMTIRPAESDAPPVTVTGDQASRLAGRLSILARYGRLSASPSPYPPKWILDVVLHDGSQINDISVGFHLDAPKQPLHGQVWLVPVAPGQSEPTAAMVDAIDRYLNPDETQREQPEEESEGE